MCKFCDNIYPEEDIRDIVFGKEKYKNLGRPEAFIIMDKDGEIDIYTDPGDPYELGLICDIKFCPYCGSKLKEHNVDQDTVPFDFELYQAGLIDTPPEFHCGIEESGGHAYNCNDCPNKCQEWYQWDKEITNERREN